MPSDDCELTVIPGQDIGPWTVPRFYFAPFSEKKIHVSMNMNFEYLGIIP